MSARIVIAALLGAAGTVAAQTSPSYIITRLGVDTVAVERYTRTNSRLEGDLVLRYPRVGVFHYVADLGPAGEITAMTTTLRRGGVDANSPPFRKIVTRFSDTLAVIDAQRNGAPDTAASASKAFRGRAAPMLGVEPTSYGIYEQLLAASRLGRDSVSFALVSPGRGPVPAIILRKRGADSVSFTSTFFPGWIEVARVDSRGQILGVDSRATTIKTVAERSPALNFDDVVKRWVAAEAAKGGSIGQMSPPDTVKAAIGGANISVAYSRPFKRGRVIFGEVVPWNQVWRTGANAATMFTTDKDLVFGTTVVPAGKYTLWTLPTPTGAKLIINSETGQWGTDYHAEKDFTRLDLISRRASPPVEQFVIGVVPKESGGELRLAWDDREYAIPFAVKQP